MTTTANLLMGLVVFILLLFGVLIKYFKCYWLISGYNSLSDKEKLEIDIIGLSSFIGNCSWVLALILLVGSVFGYLGNTIVFYISIFSVFVFAPYMIVTSQKYSHKQINKKKNFFTIMFCVIIFIFVTAVILYGIREPAITIGPQEISIGGIYGTDIKLDSVKEIYLNNSMPQIKSKTNGFNFGNILRGNFSLKETSNAKLFVHQGKQPYIWIKHDTGLIIINFNDSNKTKELYKELETKIEK